MCVAVIAAYFPLKSDPSHNIQEGGDFYYLHARRIRFAVENLSQRATLPAWYPAELMGSPFWSNVQSFPFIPTRLIVLFLPPHSVFTVGVILSAVLAALFTFLYARAVRLSPVAAAAAGWTFACSGYYASRVLAGALPLLEGYPALPLLLWLVELNVAQQRGVEPGRTQGRRSGRLAGLVVACMCLSLAGHPQLPLYAMLIAVLYLLFRSWGRWRQSLRAALAMGCGIACAGFALWPFLLLTERSTRLLPLRRAANDIALPVSRLAAFLFPWKDGWPGKPLRNFDKPFDAAYPNLAYFFDTVNYTGWLPIIACVLLIGSAIVARRRPNSLAVFLAGIGFLALVTALPAFHTAPGTVGRTILRSPSRQTYITIFTLAMALGAAVDLVRRLPIWRNATTAVKVLTAILLAAHVFDLSVHNRNFIYTNYLPADHPSAVESKIRGLVGDGRAGIDFDLAAPFNRRIDDVGFFDSIILRRPYLMVLDLNRTPRDFNTQDIQGSQMRTRALSAMGAKVVMTPARRRDLKPLGTAGDVNLYGVPDPVPRVTFFPDSAVVQITPDEMHQMMRNGRYQPLAHLLVPTDGPAGSSSHLERPTPGPATSTSQATSQPDSTAPPTYERPGSDEIVVTARNDEPGVLRVLETFDEGWRAELNGRPVPIIAADDTFLGVVLPAGQNIVRFTYHTPGTRAGLVISATGLAAFACVLLVAPRRDVADLTAASDA